MHSVTITRSIVLGELDELIYSAFFLHFRSVNDL